MNPLALIWLAGWIIVCVWTGLLPNKENTDKEKAKIVFETALYSILFWPLFLITYISLTLGKLVNKK